MLLLLFGELLIYLFIEWETLLHCLLSAHNVIVAKNLDRAAIRPQSSEQRVIGNL